MGSAWAGRIAEAAAEASGLRLACPALADVAAEGSSLRLVFLNLAAELKFSVLLRIGAAWLCFFPAQRPPHSVQVQTSRPILRWVVLYANRVLNGVGLNRA